MIGILRQTFKCTTFFLSEDRKCESPDGNAVAYDHLCQKKDRINSTTGFALKANWECIGDATVTMMDCNTHYDATVSWTVMDALSNRQKRTQTSVLTDSINSIFPYSA